MLGEDKHTYGILWEGNRKVINGERIKNTPCYLCIQNQHFPKHIVLTKAIPSVLLNVMLSTIHKPFAKHILPSGQ